jgi:hypothetical protein
MKRRGPKPKSQDGQPMRRRVIRMCDADWAATKAIGTDRARELIREEAKKKESV